MTVTVDRDARAQWVAREPGPQLGVLAKAAWREWAAEGDAAGYTRPLLTKTGDGHGHHIPGTPNEYSHGWKPVHEGAAEGGATGGGDGEIGYGPGLRAGMRDFFTGIGTVMSDTSVTDDEGTHVTVGSSGDIVVSVDQAYPFAQGPTGRSRIHSTDYEGARRLVDMLDQAISDADGYVEEADDEEDDEEREMRLVDYDFTASNDPHRVVVGYNPDGQILIGWPNDEENGVPEFDPARFGEDYNVWPLDPDDAARFRDGLHDAANLAEEDGEHIDGHLIGDDGDLAVYSNSMFSFNDADGEPGVWVTHPSSLTAIREALVKLRDGEPGSEHQVLFRSYDLDASVGDTVELSSIRWQYPPTEDGPDYTGTFQFDRANLDDTISAIDYVLGQLKERHDTIVEEAVQDAHRRHEEFIAAWRARQQSAGKALVPDLVKVGPKGYIHGWIYVGPPKVGDTLHHPDFGQGRVSRRGKATVGVEFDRGVNRSFTHAPETPDPDEHFVIRPGSARPSKSEGRFAEKTPAQRRADALDMSRRWSGNPYLRLSPVERLTTRDWKAFTDNERGSILEGVERLRDRAAKTGAEPEVLERAQAQLARFAPKPAKVAKPPAVEMDDDTPPMVRELAQRSMPDLRRLAKLSGTATNAQNPVDLARDIRGSRLRAWHVPGEGTDEARADEELRFMLREIDASKPAKKAKPAKKPQPSTAEVLEQLSAATSREQARTLVADLKGKRLDEVARALSISGRTVAERREGIVEGTVGAQPAAPSGPTRAAEDMVLRLDGPNAPQHVRDTAAAVRARRAAETSPDTAEALDALYRGEVVHLGSDDLERLLNDSKENPNGAGTNLANLDLGDYGTLFATDKMGSLPRDQMPQLGSTAPEMQAFIDELAKEGIPVRIVEIDPTTLRPSQNEISAAKTAKLYGHMKTGGWLPGGLLVTSGDGYVVDGHHRWSAAAAVRASGARPDMTVTGLIVDTDIDTTLRIAARVARYESLEFDREAAKPEVPGGHEPNVSHPGGGTAGGPHVEAGRGSPGPGQAVHLAERQVASGGGGRPGGPAAAAPELTRAAEDRILQLDRPGAPAHVRESAADIRTRRTVAAPGEQTAARVDVEQVGRDRQAAIDTARGHGELAAEVLERLHAGVTDPDVLRRVVTTTAARHGVPTDQRDTLLQTIDRGDLTVLAVTAERFGAHTGVELHGEPGGIDTFSRARHTPIGSIPEGARVEIVRPGLSLTRDGEQIQLAKPTVELAPDRAPDSTTLGHAMWLRQQGGLFRPDSPARGSLERWSRDLQAGRFTPHQAAAGIRADADRTPHPADATTLRGIGDQLDQHAARHTPPAAPPAPAAVVAPLPIPRRSTAAATQAEARRTLDQLAYEVQAGNRRDLLRGNGVPVLRAMAALHGVVGLMGGRTAVSRMKKPELIDQLLQYLT